MEDKQILNEKELENVNGGWTYVEYEIVLGSSENPRSESSSAPALPATKLEDSTYKGMFSNAAITETN